MPSEKQLAANRLNAQRSTGPRTPAGKAASAANALKTGIYSESHIIKGESVADLEALTATYDAEYHPTTATQRMLVDTLIYNEWLLRRLRRVETDIWNMGIEFLKKSQFQSKRHLIGDTFSNQQETLARLQRRIDSLDRACHRALKALRQIQGDEPQSAEPQPEDWNQPEPCLTPPVSPHPVPSQVGFIHSLLHRPIPSQQSTPCQPTVTTDRLPEIGFVPSPAWKP